MGGADGVKITVPECGGSPGATLSHEVDLVDLLLGS